MPLLVLLLGKMCLSSSSWVLKMPMDRSSADSGDSSPVPNCSCRDLIFANIRLQFHLQQVRAHSPLPLIWLFFPYPTVPSPFSLSGKTYWTQNHGTQTTQNLSKLLGKSNRSPSRWLNEGSSSHSLERIVSNMYNIKVSYFIWLLSNPGVFSSAFSGFF